MEPSIVKDIWAGSVSSGLSSLTNVNGTLYFAADDGINGTELWKTDGTAAGTTLVKDIRAGSSGSGPEELTNVNGTLYFAADDGINGRELWKTDGTATGTTLVKNIAAGPSSSEPSSLTNVNGTLYFGKWGELWKSDGTEAGTTAVLPASGYGFTRISGVTNVNGTVYYTVGGGFGTNLWKSDGTAAGTTLLSNFFRTFITDLTNVNGTLYFTNDINSLWRSDGTAAGTTLVKNIRVGGFGVKKPRELTDVNGTLYFTARDETLRWELWKTDGTTAGTTIVKDINSGNGPADLKNLTNFDGTLYFIASDPINGTGLWKSDGTAAGTTLVKPGLSSSYTNNLTNVNGTLYFAADDGINGTELWKSDGTAAGTTLVKDIRAGSSSSDPQNLINVNGTLYFTADHGINGRELWKLDTQSQNQVTNGLQAVYYDNLDFTGPTLTQTSPTVDFTWGQGAPAAGIEADTFSVRWTGQVQAQYSELYTFYTQSDDGVRLWVNDQLLIDNWTDHGLTENSGTISLAAGQKYNLKMEFYENQVDATAKLLWSSPTTPKAVVPQTQLYSNSGDGLQAVYYDNLDFTDPTVTQTNPTVDFSWGQGTPAPGIEADTFSVRWTGQVQAQYSEEYTFYTQSDDGVRLWVNDQLLIDNWTDHGLTENNGTIALQAGQKYNIRMEFYENQVDATAKLLWSSTSTVKAVIPQAQLFSNTAQNQTANSLLAASSDSPQLMSSANWLAVASDTQESTLSEAASIPAMDTTSSTDPQTDILWSNQTTGGSDPLPMNSTNFNLMATDPVPNPNWSIGSTETFNNNAQTNVPFGSQTSGGNDLWLYNPVTLPVPELSQF